MTETEAPVDATAPEPPASDPRDARSSSPLVRGAVWLHVALTWLACRLAWGVRVEGESNLPPTGAALVVSNHPSYLDPMLIVCIGIKARWRLVRFMAWDKLFTLPVLKTVLRVYGAFPVNVDKPGRESYQRLLRLLREGQLGGIFPEGGRSPNNVMGPWKHGALRAAHSAGAPVVPVTVIGARDVWPDTGLVPALFRRVKVIVHPLMTLEELAPPVEGESEKDRLGRAEEALQKIIAAPLKRIQRRRKAAQLLAYRRATPVALRRA